MAILAADIGNTNTKLGIFEGTKLIKSSYFSAFSDDIENEVLKFSGYNISRIIISCVVAGKDVQLAKILEKAFGVKAEIIKTDGIASDLLCQAAFVKASYPLPAVIFSLGTATTMLGIDGDGNPLGGLISLGIENSLRGLDSATSLLPLIEVDEVLNSCAPSMFNINTKDAMIYGAIYSAVGAIENLARMAEKEIGAKSFIITGGWANFIGKYLDKKFIIEPYAVLKGANLYEQN